MEKTFAVMIAMTLLVACATRSAAGPVTIDQANDGFSPGTYRNPLYFAPFGQEFTPTLSALDFVDLWGGGDGLVTVRIREASIDGPIVGTSDPVGFLFGELRFSFASRVRLNPGHTYVMEVVAPGGGLIASAGWNRYAGGRQVYWGTPADDDLWFREGVPEPPLVLLLVAGVAQLVRSRRRT